MRILFLTFMDVLIELFERAYFICVFIIYIVIIYMYVSVS